VTVSVEKVVAIVERELDRDAGEVNPDSTANDVEGWDSLGHLRVCMAIESAFSVSIPMDDVADLMSVPALVAFLDART
jgi:acyl carrier protein